MASRQLRGRDGAVDIAQDVLVSVIEALRSRAVREPARLPAFVAGTARNLINNYRRKHARAREVLDDPPERAADYDLELANSERERRMVVRASFRALAALDRLTHHVHQIVITGDSFRAQGRRRASVDRKES